MSTVKYTNDCATIPSSVLSGAKVRKGTEGSPTVAHRCEFDRILSTAGFIASKEGATEVIQGIFIDTEVARIV